MTIITAYRFICLEKGRLSSNWQIVVHSVCWGFPIISTVLMTVLYSNFSVKADIEPSIYHEDIFADPEFVGSDGAASRAQTESSRQSLSTPRS